MVQDGSDQAKTAHHDLQPYRANRGFAHPRGVRRRPGSRLTLRTESGPQRRSTRLASSKQPRNAGFEASPSNS